MKYLCLLLFLISCSTEHSKKLESEKERAKIAWDSIRPQLLQIDSTTNGYVYSSINLDGTLGELTPSIEFEYDSISGPNNLKLRIDFHKTDVPDSYAYLGKHIIITEGHLRKYDNYTIYEDTVDIIVKSGINELITGGGVRLGTNRGPTLKTTPGEREALKRGIMASEALKTLYSSSN